MTTAAAKTFAVTEFLEAILLDLPTRDLLLAQRVDKTFNATIQSSKKAQEALFLRTTPTGTVTNGALPVLNPFIGHLIKRDGEPIKTFSCSGECGDSESSDSEPPHLHVLKYDTLYGPLAPLSLPCTGSKKEHSWRNMFASRPPAPIFVVDWCPCHEYQLNSLKLGDFVEELRQIRDGPADSDEVLRMRQRREL